jgi:hypothetical protein
MVYYDRMIPNVLHTIMSSWISAIVHSCMCDYAGTLQKYYGTRIITDFCHRLRRSARIKLQHIGTTAQLTSSLPSNLRCHLRGLASELS